VLPVDGLSKRFGARRSLTNVTLEIREREIVGVIGPNGAKGRRRTFAV
jgi:branched-chain amino acid transport system ATP-binding protein